ncbi:MBL fold metallo-hydrolase [Clostridium formicaceticum]|uniref:MBL fold metallo-hydrolase n=1 Tax=Clostridium formicaceticum TaxID=1497 RepID=UPI001F46F622|nr:MBL fold metallo-hydrolase [Clostridium formicaceticum]
MDKETRSAAIVDPSWEVEIIVNVLSKLEVELSTILLTHSHYDHVNMVDALIMKYNPMVYMSYIEANYYRFKCKNLITIDDMDLVSVGQTEIRCLATPGHTAGGSCYLLKGSLFTGDTIFIEGCGICTGKGASAEDMFESIQKIKSIVRPDVRIYPGHSYGKKPGYSMEYLMKENIYLHINDKKHFIEFRNRKNQKNLFIFK